MRLPNQFSLRSFFVASALIGIMLAAWIGRSQKQKAAAEAISNSGGWLIYSKPRVPVPSWVVHSMGHDYFCSIDCVSLFPTDAFDADEQIKILENTPYLRSLGIWPGARTRRIAANNKPRRSESYAEFGFEPIPNSYLPNEWNFPGGLSEAGLDYLLETLPDLENLSLFSARIPQDSESLANAKKRIAHIQCRTHTAFKSSKQGLQ